MNGREFKNSQWCREAGSSSGRKKYRKAIKNGCNALMICDRIEISDELLKYGATLNINDEKKPEGVYQFSQEFIF